MSRVHSQHTTLLLLVTLPNAAQFTNFLHQRLNSKYVIKDPNTS